MLQGLGKCYGKNTEKFFCKALLKMRAKILVGLWFSNKTKIEKNTLFGTALVRKVIKNRDTLFCRTLVRIRAKNRENVVFGRISKRANIEKTPFLEGL